MTAFKKTLLAAAVITVVGALAYLLNLSAAQVGREIIIFQSSHPVLHGALVPILLSSNVFFLARFFAKREKSNLIIH